MRIKETVFPQAEVRSLPKYAALNKSLNHADAGVFFMLADATCSGQPKVDIEKIHVNVFEHKKITMPGIGRRDLETLEILTDAELLREIMLSREEARKEELVPWQEARTAV